MCTSLFKHIIDVISWLFPIVITVGIFWYQSKIEYKDKKPYILIYPELIMVDVGKVQISTIHIINFGKSGAADVCIDFCIEKFYLNYIMSGEHEKIIVDNYMVTYSLEEFPKYAEISYIFRGKIVPKEYIELYKDNIKDRANSLVHN